MGSSADVATHPPGCHHRVVLLRRLGFLVVAVALLASACGVSGQDSGTDASPPTATAAPTEPSDEPLGGRAVLEGLRGSVALIDTPIASGSAVLLDDGYLVTNAHVIDPFDVVDVTFEGDDTELDVEVVGVDLDADLAVLGPIETDHEPVALVDPTDLDQGSDLFLVGFPGDQADPEVTISTGVLSRRRQAEDWGLDFLQSDTKIAPGQSGGALVDDQGRVIGISGLSDEDDYALTLSGEDVVASVEEILDGDGSEWLPAPQDATETAATFEVIGRSDPRVLYFPAAEDERMVTVDVDGPDPLVELDDVGQFPLALNQAAFDALDENDDPDLELPEPTEPDADGRYTFPIEAGFPALLYVGAGVEVATPLSVTTSEPFAVVAGDPEVTPIKVDGDPVEGTLGYLDPTRVFSVDLDADDEFAITASSAVGDVAYSVVAPGEALDAAEEVDDGGGGLFDLDASGTYTAETAGTHQLRVYQVEGVATGYRLTVEPA